jgi:hypothetical protein
LHVIETADHSFHVLKSSGETDGGILKELARTAATWTRQEITDRSSGEGRARQ